MRFNKVCYLFSCILLNTYIYVILDRMTEIKANNAELTRSIGLLLY